MYEAGGVAVTGLLAYLDYRRRVWKRRYENAAQESKLDPKTGLLTYPAFTDEVIRRTESTQRSQDVRRIHGLVFADIDDFGLLNQALTHPVTDEKALLPVAEVLTRAVRPDTDLVARFGGEEFVIFLSDVDPMQVGNVCRRIQNEVNSIRPDANSLASIGVTVAHTVFGQGDSYKEVFQKLSAGVVEVKEVPNKNQIVAIGY